MLAKALQSLDESLTARSMNIKFHLLQVLTVHWLTAAFLQQEEWTRDFSCPVYFQEFWASLAPVSMLCWTFCNKAWTLDQGHSACTTHRAWPNWPTSLCTSCALSVTHHRPLWDTCEPPTTFCSSSFDICRLIRWTTVSSICDSVWLCHVHVPRHVSMSFLKKNTLVVTGLEDWLLLFLFSFVYYVSLVWTLNAVDAMFLLSV